MFVGLKRYSRSGRERYGSSVFIDDTLEELVDTVTGTKRDTTLISLYVFIILIKIIAANFIGIMILSPLFFISYYLTTQDQQISFTEKRVFVSQEYRHPRLTKFIGWIFLGLAVYSIIKAFYPNVFDTTTSGVKNMQFFFEFFNILPIFYFFYSQSILLNLTAVLQLEAIISLFVYIPLSMRFLFIHYNFSEIHNSHVGKIIFTMDKDGGWLRTSIISLSIILIHIFFISNFSLIIALWILIFNEFVPNTRIAKFSLIGNSDRPIINKLILKKGEFGPATRGVAAIFGWIPQGDYSNRNFPNNVIPYEVASHYETGLRASISEAFSNGNKIGLLISSMINLIVILDLFRFALNKNRQSLQLVGLLIVGLFIFSTIVYQILANTIPAIFNIQREENLIIGQTFVARYREPSLWIIRGNKLEGTNVQRGVKNRLIHYDRNIGLVVAWRRFIFYVIAFIAAISLAIWAISGGINFANAFFIFPFLFDQSINFLSNKATAELGFFIVVSYAIWITIFFYSPRYYARSRPMLLLEMNSPDYVPIILKDFDDHKDASLQFTKCLMNTARPTRRRSFGRPGTFKMDVYFLGFDYQIEPEGNPQYRLFLGENKRKTEFIPVIALQDSKIPILSSLQTSAERGFPLVSIIIEKKIDRQCYIVYKEKVELKNNSENHLEIEIEDSLKLHLSITTDGGKS